MSLEAMIPATTQYGQPQNRSVSNRHTDVFIALLPNSALCEADKFDPDNGAGVGCLSLSVDPNKDDRDAALLDCPEEEEIEIDDKHRMKVTTVRTVIGNRQ